MTFLLGTQCACQAMQASSLLGISLSFLITLSFMTGDSYSGLLVSCGFVSMISFYVAI